MSSPQYYYTTLGFPYECPSVYSPQSPLSPQQPRSECSTPANHGEDRDVSTDSAFETPMYQCGDPWNQASSQYRSFREDTSDSEEDTFAQDLAMMSRIIDFPVPSVVLSSWSACVSQNCSGSSRYMVYEQTVYCYGEKIGQCEFTKPHLVDSLESWGEEEMEMMATSHAAPEDLQEAKIQAGDPSLVQIIPELKRVRDEEEASHKNFLEHRELLRKVIGWEKIDFTKWKSRGSDPEDQEYKASQQMCGAVRRMYKRVVGGTKRENKVLKLPSDELPGIPTS